MSEISCYSNSFMLRTRSTLLLAGMLLAIMSAQAVAQQPSTSPSQVSAIQPPRRVDFYVGLARVYPPSVTLPAGPYQIVLNNSTYGGALDVMLQDSGAHVLTQSASVSQVKHRRGITVTLTPGTYVLQVVGHPKWTATIVVTSAKP